MFFSVAAISDIGCVREKNEDNFVCDFYLKEIHRNNDFYYKKLVNSFLKTHLYGVFDGMGGCDRGEISSYIAAQIACQLHEKVDKNNQFDLLNKIFLKSNEEICKYMSQENIQTGTTASLVCIDKNSIIFANLGDSPIFRLRNGVLEEMYQEHTDRKIYELFNGSSDKKKFKLTQHIGIYPDELLIEPYYKEDMIEKGDIYIICSDGLTDMLTKKEISKVLSEMKYTDVIANELVRLAKNAGGKDNITVICIKIL